MNFKSREVFNIKGFSAFSYLIANILQTIYITPAILKIHLFSCFEA